MIRSDLWWALHVADRGVVCEYVSCCAHQYIPWSRQKLSVHEQLDIARHFGHLHKHATITVPRDPGLEEVHGESGLLKGPNGQWHPSDVYNDAARRPDDCAFSKIEFWHSDMTYEIRPLSTTSLRVTTGPEYGGDTLFGLFIPPSVQQEYFESLTALPRKRRDLARLASKSVASVNPGVTRRMLAIPKSDITLNVLFHQVAEGVDFQVRFHWERTVSTQ